MYRIGYLNPFIGRAEEQAFHSLALAAKALGFEMTAVLPSELHENSPFDFLISTSSAVGKTTSHPIFLSGHLPRGAYFEAEETFENLASYDGYLCIADSLTDFFASIAASLDKAVVQPGFYYNSPQIVDFAADIPAICARGELALCYFGTNWDPRAKRLFRRLAIRPYARIYGPEGAWNDIPPHAYKGAAPFDGVSVQRTYAAYGAGLVCLSQDHLLDDIVSNRIFEIVSAGACAICPDTPWMRANFADSVFYYRPFAVPDDILSDIDEAMRAIAADPAAAQAMASEARSRFEGRFDAQTLLANAGAYFDRWRAAGAARVAHMGDPVVDVIIRVGGRDLSFIERAIASLDRQTAGRFRVVFVAYRPVDLSAITARSWSRIVAFEVVQAPGGNRSRTLGLGLDQVKSDYFCILDDDDYFLSGHIEGLLAALGRSADADRFAYADVLRLDDAGRGQGVWDNGLEVLKAGPAHGDIYSLLQRFTSHCFLATSSTLKHVRRAHWKLHTAEDVLLICALLRYATPLHSPNASCVYSQGRDDGSAFLQDPNRRADELGLYLEVAPWRVDIEARFRPPTPSARDFLAPVVLRLVEAQRQKLQGDTGGALLAQCLEISLSEADFGGQAFAWGEDVLQGLLTDEPMVFLAVPFDGGRYGGADAAVEAAGAGEAVRVRPTRPWEIALNVDIGDYAVPGCSTTALAVLDGVDAPLSLGLLNGAGEIIAQTQAPASTGVLALAVAGPDATPLAKAIVQAGALPPSKTILVRSLMVGYRLSDLRDAFAADGLDGSREALLARLQARIFRTSVNPPQNPPSRLEPINFRSRRCLYLGVTRDGPYAAGALREIGSGVKPWDYFARVHVPAAQAARALWLKVTVRDTREAFHLLMVDETFATALSPPVLVPAGKEQVEIWLDAHNGQDGGFIVFQAGETPRNLPMTLVAVEAGA